MNTTVETSVQTGKPYEGFVIGSDPTRFRRAQSDPHRPPKNKQARTKQTETNQLYFNYAEEEERKDRRRLKLPVEGPVVYSATTRRIFRPYIDPASAICIRENRVKKIKKEKSEIICRRILQCVKTSNIVTNTTASSVSAQVSKSVQTGDPYEGFAIGTDPTRFQGSTQRDRRRPPKNKRTRAKHSETSQMYFVYAEEEEKRDRRRLNLPIEGRVAYSSITQRLFRPYLESAEKRNNVREEASSVVPTSSSIPVGASAMVEISFLSSSPSANLHSARSSDPSVEQL